MDSDASSSPPQPARGSGAARWPRGFRWLLLFGSVLGFAVLFDPERQQAAVDALWILALALWVADVRAHGAGQLLTVHPGRNDLLLIAALLIIFAVAWLPFYDNWRWAYTADSLVWFTFARAAARGELSRNLLSVHGVDDNFTYLHSLASNGLLFIFEPTLLWHRIGKLIVSCLSLAAIYAYFALALGRWWASAVVACTAVNYVWLWFSYVSYGHIDSFIFSYLTLTLATLIWRRPEHPGQWMMCGLIGGCALFFTQTAWSAVAAVGFVLLAFALLTRRTIPAVVYLLSFLLVATPILLQLPAFLQMAIRQTRSVYSWGYLTHIFTDIVRLPYDWNYCRIGVQGAFLRWPLGSLYPLGLALAALSLVPPVRRALRVPGVARILLALFLWDAVLMTLTNNAYAQPSTKRTYNLVPMQVFFGLLPLHTLCACTRGRRLWHWLGMAVTVTAIGAYGIANLWVLANPRPRIYGYNVFDAMIELHQRFPQRQVVLFSSRTELGGTLLDAGSVLNTVYHVQDTVGIEPRLTPTALLDACAAHTLVCYEPNFDAAALGRMVRLAPACLRPVPLLNTIEAACFECQPAACPRALSDADLMRLLGAPDGSMYRNSCD